MSTEDVRSVSSVTGTFRQLRSVVDGQRTETGKREAPTGKNVPAVAQSEPEVRELAKKLNIETQSLGRDLRFEVDMESGRSVISVLDRDTGEVIRQIPPEKARLYVSESGAVALRLVDAEA